MECDRCDGEDEKINGEAEDGERSREQEGPGLACVCGPQELPPINVLLEFIP